MTVQRDLQLARIQTASYPSRAAALVGRLPGYVEALHVGELAYVRAADPEDGTWLQLADGSCWEPAGLATLAHAGIVGAPVEFAASGLPANAPAVDELIPIRRAIRWCLERGRDLASDPARIYGVSDQLVWGHLPGEPPIRGGCTLHQINLAPVDGWAGGMGDTSDPDPLEWDVGTAVLRIGGWHGVAPNPARLDCDRPYVDCRGIAGTGIQFVQTLQGRWDAPRVDRAVNCHIRIGDGLSTGSATDCIIREPHVRENPYGQPGYGDPDLRSSIGLLYDSSDMEVAGGHVTTCRYNLVGRFGYNISTTGLTSWTGEDRAANRVAAVIGPDFRNYRFTGCRFDDARVRVFGLDGGFLGCLFSQFNTALELVATEAAEHAIAFVFVGNRENGNGDVLLSATGAGSWGDFRGQWSGNLKSAPGAAVPGPWTVQGKSAANEFFAAYPGGRGRAALITPPAGLDAGVYGQYGIGADYRLYVHDGTQWRRSDPLATY